MWAHITYRWTDVNVSTVSTKEEGAQAGEEAAYMYSMVPQKVWVTVPSWIDSLHSPKSVSFTWPGRKTDAVIYNPHTYTRTSALNHNQVFIYCCLCDVHDICAHVWLCFMVKYKEDFVWTNRAGKVSSQHTHLGCWAWCSQASGLCRWCPSGAGGPEPWRSLPGRNYTEKQRKRFKKYNQLHTKNDFWIWIHQSDTDMHMVLI